MDGAAMFEVGDTNLLLLAQGTFVAALFSAFGGSLVHLARCPAGTEAHWRESRRDRATLLAPRSCEPRSCTFRTAWLACARSIRHVRRGERGRPRRGNPRSARHFGHDLIVQALSVLAALVLLTAWPSRRFAALGLALTLQARHS